MEPNDIMGIKELTQEVKAELFYVYKEYESFLKSKNAIDFDDMISKTYHFLKGNKKALKYAQRKFKYYLIDEAHDLSYSQIELLKLITDNNVTFVFDVRQSIYSFRCAVPKTFLKLLNDRNYKVVDLPINYRNPKNILEHSNKLIAHNPTEELGMLPEPNKLNDGRIEVINNPDIENEAMSVYQKILDLKNEGYNYKDIAILFRTHAQSRAVIDALIINEIPHVVLKGSFYQRKEIKDVISYLRIAINRKMKLDDLKRICNKPLRYINKEKLKQLYGIFKKNKKRLANFRDCIDNHAFDVFESGFKAQSIFKLAHDLDVVAKKDNTTQMVASILHEVGLEKHYREQAIAFDSESDLEMNFDAIYALADKYPEPDKFLGFVDGVVQNEAENAKKDDCVQLMSIHGSKGEEFPNVILLSACNITMPHEKSKNIDEERRICYVALTRAEENLYISTLTGKLYRRNAYPSRFISEAGLSIPKVCYIKNEN